MQHETKKIKKTSQTPNVHETEKGLTPNTGLGTETRRGLAPNTVAATPAARGGERSSGAFTLSTRGGSTGRAGADRGDAGTTLLTGLRARSQVARRRGTGRAGGVGTTLGADSIVKDLVIGTGALRASGAVGARAQIVLARGMILGSGRGTSISRRAVANAVIGHGRSTAKAGGAAGSGGALANVAALIHVASLVGERTFTVQSAALASNQLASLLLGHVLAVVARVGAGGGAAGVVLSVAGGISEHSYGDDVLVHST